MTRDPASFRDPAGHVHLREGRVFRTVLPPGVANFEAARASGLLDEAARAGQLIAGTEVDPGLLGDEAPDARYLIEHPRLDFISYPYEWCFEALRDAALLTLDLHRAALARGLTLSDSSAYNVQFVGPRPLFIDYLSLIRYEPGQVWFGYRQFCEQFLNPLLLTAVTGVPFQAQYRGTLQGIRSRDLAALLPLRARLGPRTLLHVVLQARLEARPVSAARVEGHRGIRISKEGLAANLGTMRSWVASLRPPAAQRSPWQDYERTAHYTADERARKAQVVADAVRAAAPGVAWDLGCNAGEYSELALTSGARSVIGFEPDPGALNAAWRRARERQLAFLPLCVDVTNPSPDSGWAEAERAGLAARRNADLVLALALVHHLILGRDVPMPACVAWLTGLARRGVVEFVPKDDPMARQLLALKPDTQPDYEVEAFAATLARAARIERRETVTASGRTLFVWSRV